MKLKEKILLFMIMGIIILVIIFPEISFNSSPPKAIYIEVLNQEGIRLSGAFCRANITTEDRIMEDVPLYEISNIKDYLPSSSFAGTENKGYYKLETGLTDKDKIFEIKITCIVIEPKRDIISFTLNNTNTFCDLREGYLVC